MSNHYFIFDIETSGQSPRWHSIIELSGILLDADLRELEFFSERVKPISKSWDADAEGVHGISLEEASDAQDAPEFLGKLKDFLPDNCTAIVHAAHRKHFRKYFDYEFLINMSLCYNYFHSLVYAKIPLCKSTIVSNDYFPIYKTGGESQKLDIWGNFLGIEFDHHNSLEDAGVTVEVFKYQYKIEEKTNRNRFYDEIQEGYHLMYPYQRYNVYLIFVIDPSEALLAYLY